MLNARSMFFGAACSWGLLFLGKAGICLLTMACGESDRNSSTQDGASTRGRSSAEATAVGATTAGTGGSWTSSDGTDRTAGSGGSSSDTGGIIPPNDTRPERPEWEPEIPIGDPGWENSTTPLCEPHQGAIFAFDVWADERGVYALFATACNPFAPTEDCAKDGVALQFNDGSGWKWLYQPVSAANLKLTGFPNGPLIVSGELEGRSGIFFFEDGEFTLSHPTDQSPTVFVAGEGLAYALVDQDVLEYRDGEWGELMTLPMRPLALGAAGETLVVAGQDQVFQKAASTAELEPLSGVPAGFYNAVWAFSEDDVWVGNDLGQLVHFDGMGWNVVETGVANSSDSAIISMWGQAGVLYFATYSEFGRHDEEGVEPLIQHSSELDPVSLWGRSQSEVFLALGDQRFADYACGGAFIVWFDGSEFHQF